MPSQPQTVTIAQALASNSSGLLVADTAAHIVAALPNTALTARVASFTIAAPAILTAAQMSLLFPIAAKLHAQAGFLALSGANVCTVAQLGVYEGLSGFTVASGGSITLSDSTAQITGMLSNHPAWFAQVSAVTIHLDGTSIGAYPASQFNGLISHGKSVVFVQSGNYTTLNVAAAAHDLATNAPSLNALASHVGLTIAVTNDGTGISAADATSLIGLQGFHPSAHTIFVSDTGANLSAHLGAVLGQGFAQIQVVSGTLAGTAAQLTNPTIHFASGAHAQLSASATVGASTAATLASLPGLSAASGAVLLVSDTAANLLSNSGSWLSAAGAVALSADATVSAAAAQGLGQIASSFGARFSLAGHGLTVADTLAAIEGLPPSTASLAAGFALTANAVVSAAQFGGVQAITHLNLAGHTIAIADTAPALLALAGSDLGRATSVSLSGDATVSVAQMHALAAEPGFNTAGHSLTVADHASTLSGLTPAEAALATVISVSGDATLNASQFSVLSALPNLSLNGNPLTVIDTATNLSGLTTHLSLIGATTLSADAAVSVATFGALSALPAFTTGGHALSLVDTAGNLLLLAGGDLSQITATTLSADALVSAQQAQTLASEPGFSKGSHQFVITDNAASLLALSPALLQLSTGLALSSDQTVSASSLTQLAAFGGKFSAAGHALAVIDTASALLGLSRSDLGRATSVSLSADATVSVAQTLALSAMPVFNTAGHALIVADTAANLLAAPQGTLSSASAIELSADATLSAAAAQALTSKAGYIGDAHTLTIADTAATLAGLTTPVVALASAEQVTVSATITAATATALASLPQLVEAAGVTLTIQDTMTTLLALGAPAKALASTIRLVPGSTTSTDVAHAAALAGLPGFSASNATISVTDTLADLNASATSGWSTVATTYAVVDTASAIIAAAGSTVLGSASSVSLSAPAVISAFDATNLAGMTNFTGVQQVTVTDTAAALIANAPALIAFGCPVNVADSAIVTVAGASSLVQIQATSSHFSFGAQTLTISDTATHLVGLTHAETALASMTTLSGDATVTAPQFGLLAAIPNLSLNGHLLTVADTAANLTSLNSHLSLISATSLTADAMVNAATFSILSGLPAFSNGGRLLTVADSAGVLLGLAGSNLSQITAISLSADAVVNALQAQTLAGEPGFTTGGHQLTISDTAANILTLPHALLVTSSELALSGNQTVSASTLTQLAALGLKFNEAGHSVTCVDTAGNLAALSSPAIALAGSEVIAANATISAATAAALASLPNLFAGTGVVLTVQDSVANILAVGSGITPLVSSETLPAGSVVTITAGQAVALTNLSHFSAAGATITVADTVAALNIAGPSVLQSIASSIDVIDSAANLASASSSTLLQDAAAVMLAGNAQVTATAGAQLATIPNFSAGPYQLTVADTAANTAQHYGAILTLGAHALVTDSGPVTAAVSDRLAVISTAGFLSFQGGNQLLVQDSYADLISSGNASGVGLAARLGVLDTASNLVTASGHNWGALNPTYTLSQGGLISAAIANGLAAIGSHFFSAGLAFSVSDTAANVVGSATSLSTLNVTAAVTDTASNVVAQAANLVSMGSEIASINLTDTSPVTAATAGGLAALASRLSSPALLVAGNAADVDAQLSQLQTLGSHVSITVHDVATNVGTYATDLSTLGINVTVSLTDVMAVSALTAVALAPVASQLAGGTQLAVNDTGASISANATSLAGLSAHIGNITLSDGYTVSAANAALLSSLDSHFASGIQFTVTGSTAAVALAQAGLVTLYNDGHLAAVDIVGTTVADVSAYITTINALSANVSISDTASNVDAALPTLAQINHLQSISLTDSGTPALSVDVAVLNADMATIAKISSAFTLTIADTAAHISADLALGSSSTILNHLSNLGQIQATDAGTVTLTQDQSLAAGVNDSPTSALALFSGAVEITDVDLTHISQVASGAHTSITMDISDTAAHISADLALGNTSALLTNSGLIRQVSALDGAIILTQQQALVNGVADSSASILSKTSYTNFVVTAATVAGITQLTGLTQLPTSIAISDSAANLSSDLALPNSAIVGTLPAISTISVSDGQPITLTETQVMAAHVDDGSGSALSKVIGAQLMVSQVAASDLTSVLSLSVAPTQVSLSDTAGHVLSTLSTIEADISFISAIDIVGPTPLTLTASDALSSHVDDGAGSIIDRLVGHNFQVSGSSVSQLSTLSSLADVPSVISLSDTSTNLVADLISGHSVLASHSSLIGTIGVIDGLLILTDTQATAILADNTLSAVFTKLDSATQIRVTDVPIADVSAILGSGWQNISVDVADTTAAIAADLASPSSILAADAASCSSVTLTAGGTVSAATLGGMALLHSFSANGYALTLEDNVAGVLGLNGSTLGLADAVHIVDNDSDVSSALDDLQLILGGHLTITLSNNSPAITVTAAQYTSDKDTIDAVTNTGIFNVTGSAAQVTAIASALAADPVVGQVTVTDTASNVVANISLLQGSGSKLHVSVTDASITANLIAPLLTISNLSPAGITVVDAGSQIAAAAENGGSSVAAYIQSYGATLSSDSPVTAADAAALGALSNFSKGGHALVVWDTAQHLASTTYGAALVLPIIDGVYLKAPGGAVTVSSTQAAALLAISQFQTTNPDGSLNTFTVSDTAQHIEQNSATLTSHRSEVSSIVVTGSQTISDQVLSDLQSLSAVATAGTHLTVQDTASTIASSAVAQTTPSVTISPSAWTLSGNGSVTEAAATVLGGLSNFSAGSYRVSLGLSADLSVSISDANKLGNIATALDLSGHHLMVQGSVAQLSALSNAALTISTPVLADTVANVSALSQTSALLQGTVEITGNDALTATNAAALFALIQTGGSGPGIRPSALSFDNVHSVTDTVAHLQQVTSSQVWSSNAAIHSSFHLTAADTVNNLTNTINTTYLSGLYGTTLLGDVTVGAADAESLGSIASSIHFNRGSFHITVQDTAGALIDPANASGLGLADTVGLASPARLDAADSEALLGLNHLNLTTDLTIADSSAALLDNAGALQQAIVASGSNSHILVELDGPETLDVETAQSLVNITGFSDTSNLTVADDPSYLLSSANLSAEQMAVEVTLPSDEIVSASTILRLTTIPHFTAGAFHLDLANNDFADASTLKAIADLGTSFQSNSHSLTMTGDALSLTASEYNALQSDNINTNGHLLGILSDGVTVADTNNLLSVSGHGVNGEIIKIYGADGSFLSSASPTSATFTITASDTSPGHNFTMTSTAPNGGSEGAPVVILDTAMVEDLVVSAGLSFASSGLVEVESGKFLDIYNSSTVPSLTHPALVYDQSAHTVSLDMPGHSSFTLVTLGGTTHPNVLTASEFVFKFHG